MHALLDSLLPLWGVCQHEGNTVISAAFPYLLPEEHYAGRNISRYAVPQDYHKICGARLEKACVLLRAAFPGEEFHWHCDSNALPEVELATQAGLGARGKHNLLITEQYGTWVFLGEIVTQKVIGAVGAASRPPAAHNCSGCAACIHACPTGALSETGFAKEKCLSFITQKKGALSSEEAALLRTTGIIWGCDLCQEACPRNRNAKIAPLPEFLLGPIAHVTETTPIANRAYAWRGEGVLRRNCSCLFPPAPS